MRTFKNVLIAVLCLILVQYNIYGQSADITEGCHPLSVEFTPTAGLTSFFWNFQNGATSAESNPSAVFTEPGTYDVTLSESINGPVLATITIEVLPIPDLSITADPSMGCAPAQVSFNSTSSIDPAITVNQYSWVFGGGNSGSGIAPTTTYSLPGVYTVSLNVQAEQEGCSTTTVFPDFITLGGVTGLSFFTIPTPLISCEPPLEVQFFNVIPPGLADYSWDFGNGQTYNGNDPPNQIFDDPGTYNIVLTATDDEGCSATRQRTVRLVDPLGSLNFPDTICLEDYIFYDEFAEADSLIWTFPPSSSLHIENGERYALFHEGGPQQITLSAINTSPFYCEKDTTFTVFVDEVFAELTAEPTYTCEHELDVNFTATSTTNASFTWNFNGLGFDEGPEVSFSYMHYDTSIYGMNGLNQYYTSLIAINPSGCRDTLIRADTIYVPNALFMPDVVSGCAPLTVTFSDSTASQEPVLQWNFDYGDGFTETLFNDDDHSHTFTEEGTYEVMVDIVNEAGCRDTSYVRIIEVGTPLDIEYVYNESDVCYGDTIEYTVINPPEELDWVHLMEPDTLFAYYNGCLTQVSNPDITVHGPNVKMTYEIDCEEPFTVNFSGEYFDVENVLWDFDDGESSTLESPIHRYDEVGDYWVKVTATNTNSSCPTVIDSMLICIRNLVADFELPDAICANETLTLDATMTNDAIKDVCAGGYTWYFDINGRPIQGNDTLLMKPFGTPGRETVTLIAKDINGCRDTLSKLMSIYSITPDFVADDEFICMPATVNFTDLSVADTTLVNWTWSFGDSETATTEGGATHTYTNLPGGAFIDVILELEDAQGCTAVDTIGLQIYEPNSNVITDPSPANICVGETIDFSGAQFTTGGSSLQFTWDFNDGSPIQTQEISQTYNEEGSFPLNLHFVEIATGCQGDVGAIVNVQNYPTAAFTSSEDDSAAICFPAQISFSNESTSTSGISSYDWDFGNGDGSFNANPTVTFDRGMFTVELTVGTSFGCTDQITHSYEVVGPDGSFSFAPAAICEGEEVTFSLIDTMDVSSYSWNFGDGNSVDDISPVTHAFDNITQLGQFPVVLILRGAADQCVIDVTEFIQIHDVRADFSLNNDGDLILCTGEYPFINSSSGADQFLWTFDDGTTSTEFEPMQTFTPGQYDVTLQVNNLEFGCEDELMQSFEFFAPPSIMALGDSICPGDTAFLQILNVEEGWTYNWTPAGDLFPASNIQNPMAVLQEATTFQVQVTDTLGCISSGTAIVNVIPPFPWEDIDAVRCPDDSLNIEIPVSDEFFNVIWSPAPPPLIVGEEDIDLSLTIEDIIGCYSDDYTFFVQSISDSIALPNIFSPNGDGVNDVFRLFSEIDFERTDLIVIKSFTVFNRWGQKVYEGNGPLARWDGNVDGNPAPSDVYIYQISVDILKSGRSEEFKGGVTLIR